MSDHCHHYYCLTLPKPPILLCEALFSINVQESDLELASIQIPCSKFSIKNINESYSFKRRIAHIVSASLNLFCTIQQYYEETGHLSRQPLCVAMKRIPIPDKQNFLLFHIHVSASTVFFSLQYTWSCQTGEFYNNALY